MKKILVVGSGTREHVICETLKRSPQEVSIAVFGTSNNPGILSLTEKYTMGDTNNVDEVVAFAQTFAPDFAVIGPEDPIGAGVVDALKAVGIPSASPLRSAGQVETSKTFTRDLLTNFNIDGNPKYASCTSRNDIVDVFKQLGPNFVVKADGLKGGKGVKVSGDHLHGVGEGEAYALQCLSESGQVVVEEKLVGQEFSLLSFCDGKTTVDMPPCQDHKRALEGDQGPNTGGMGSYSDANHLLPFLTEADIKQASDMTKQVAQALFATTGVPFTGIMYGGFMATREGVRLIEYNARFGDPEVMNVLPILETDFVEICEAIIEGRLHELAITFASKATVVKHIVPEGYPGSPVTGEKIEISGVPQGAALYYGAVDQRADGLYLLGSRAMAAVGIGDTIADAEALAEQTALNVVGPVYHRADIGKQELINDRINMMRDLRSK